MTFGAYVLHSIHNIARQLFDLVDTINTMPRRTGLVPGRSNWPYLEMFVAATMAAVTLDSMAGRFSLTGNVILESQTVFS